jgi:hypothetical protein
MIFGPYLPLCSAISVRRYYGHKKQAARKEKKTVDASKMVHT